VKSSSNIIECVREIQKIDEKLIEETHNSSDEEE
jgi:hypothetical protein